MAEEIIVTKEWSPKEGLLVRHLKYKHLAVLSKTGSLSKEYGWILVPLTPKFTASTMFNESGVEKLAKEWTPLHSGTVVSLEQE